jgi:hypothetical protein
MPVDWLTPTEETALPPPDGIPTQGGAYAGFAPNPQWNEAGLGDPRRAIYILGPSECPKSAASCAYPTREILGRIDPPIDASEPSATPPLSASLEPTPTPEMKHWSVAELLASSPSTPSDKTYAVDGWLLQTAAAPCAAPPDMSAAHDYWCGGSWLTDEETDITSGGSVQLTVSGGSHVQWDAYREFAPNPSADATGGEARQGTYLVKPAGCPPNVMGDCPVWQMVGRLDPPMTASPAASPDATDQAASNVYPTSIDGEPVYVGTGVTDHLSHVSDDTPFFVGGVVTQLSRDCFIPADWPTSPLLPTCGGNWALTSTSASGSFGIAPVFDDPSYVLLDIPAVYKAHIHDPRAADCPATYRAQCEAAFAIDGAAWSIATPLP